MAPVAAPIFTALLVSLTTPTVAIQSMVNTSNKLAGFELGEFLAGLLPETGNISDDVNHCQDLAVDLPKIVGAVGKLGGSDTFLTGVWDFASALVVLPNEVEGCSNFLQAPAQTPMPRTITLQEPPCPSRHGDPEDSLAHCCRAAPCTGPGRPVAAPVPVAVTLRVYDMGTSGRMVNHVLESLSIGLFHCGVEIFSTEWSYSGSTDEDSESGVFSCRPGLYEGCSYRMAVPMGTSLATRDDVRKLLVGLDLKWSSSKFDLLRHNSCHFCDEFCRKLGVGGIPARLVTLTDAATYLERSVQHFTAC